MRRSQLRMAGRISALAAALLLSRPDVAAAHAFPRPYDLPLPLSHYLLGAGGAVAVSFLAALGLIRRPMAARERAVALPAGPTEALLLAVQVLSVALLGLLVAAGVFGNQGDWDRNILPVAVWVAWWVGMAFACALAGDLWAVVNPWAAVGRWAFRRPPPFRLPEAVGVWPGVMLFLVFAWIELVWPSNAVPARLACAILVYSVLTWGAMALFGTEDWLRRGEVFALVFGLFARFAPVAGHRDETGRPWLVLRRYGVGLAAGPLPSVSMTALVIVVLATVSFDGFAETPAWGRLAGAGIGLLYQTGFVGAFGYVAAQSLVKTAGLLAAPLVFAALYLAACSLAARLHGSSTGGVARWFVLSLVPIAIGYHLAHYFSYLIVQGQMILPLASDPFGSGRDIFGLRDRPLDIDAVDMRLIWIVAVGGIVLGHAAAALLAHGAALRASMRPAAQMPLALLMVGYTVLSLWILSQPITSH